MAVTILDGPLGTELLARGVPTPLPGWSAHALETAPETVAAIHRDYAIAGATVLTANTFRTKRRVLPDRWEALAREAVRIARAEAPAGGRVAGSIAPLEDCYRPDLSPADGDPDACRAEHAELAAVLADAGCDLLLCETHPHVGEALLAVEAAVATGVETWLALSPGYRADLLSPDELARAAVRAVERGARAVLVNCVPAAAALGFVRALVDAAGGAPVGCYANGGSPDAVMGWTSSPPAVEDYAELAAEWIRAGAEIVGGCCGTGPPHVARLAARFCD